MSQDSQQNISLHVLESVTRKKSFHTSCCPELHKNYFLLYSSRTIRTKHANKLTLENRTLLVNAPSLPSSNNPWESQLLQQDLKEIKLVEKYPDVRRFHMHAKRAALIAVQTQGKNIKTYCKVKLIIFPTEKCMPHPSIFIKSILKMISMEDPNLLDQRIHLQLCSNVHYNFSKW